MIRKLNKILCLILSLSFILETPCFAEGISQLNISGYLTHLHNQFLPDKFRPLHLRYLSYNHEADEFRLLLDKGDVKNLRIIDFEDTSKVLMQYFLIGVSLPNSAFWVNLRPDGQENIIDDYLAQTDIGKIMLEADLQLKKDTAKATSPETSEGREYWDKLYEKAEALFGSESLTIPTLTRPWIVPGEIIIRETSDSAYIYKANLKVMLEQDYLKGSTTYSFKDSRLKELNEYSSQLIREIIIPKLTKEVNTSKRYAPLRQVYYSLIMAQWFKARFRGKPTSYSSLIDRGELVNLASKDNWSKATYFEAYQKSFKDGEYNIKEPLYTPYGQSIRNYFSGGMNLEVPARDFEPGGSIISVPAISGFPVVDKEKLAEITFKADDKFRVSILDSDYTPDSSAVIGTQVSENNQGSLERMNQIVRGVITRISPLQPSFRSPLKFILSKLSMAVVAVAFLAVLALPNIVSAAKFEIVEGPKPGKAQVVATVEQGDTAWDIAGTAYKGTSEIGKGKYAAHTRWTKIYEANPQVHNRQNNALRPMYPDGAAYKDDKHIIMNIRPGDKLSIPGEINYAAIGLKAPVPESQIKPVTEGIKPLEITTVKQQEQTKQELQDLQEQRSQAGQELKQIQKQRQIAQEELERLQKEKTELTGQILGLKKELADIQEQLRRAKERIPANLQTEEGRRQVLQEEIRLLEQKKTQFTQEIADLEKQYKKAQEDLSRITAQKARASEELGRLHQQAPQAQAQIKDLQAEINTLENQRKQYQEDLSQLKNQNGTLVQSINQLSKEKEKLQREAEELKKQISQTEQILDEARSKIKKGQESLWDSLSFSGKAGVILLFLSGIGAVILLRKWARLRRMEQQIEGLKNEAEGLESKLASLRAEEKGLIKTKQDAEKAKVEAQEETRRIAHEQAQLKEEKERLDKERQNLQKEREEAERQKRESADLEKQKETVRREIKKLETERDDFKKTLTQAQNEAQETIRLAREQAELIRNEARISRESLTEEERKLQDELKAKTQEVAAQISVLEEKLQQAQTEHERRMGELKQKEDKVQRDIDGLISVKESTEKELKEMNKTIKSLQEAKTNMLSELSKLVEQQEKMQLRSDKLKSEESGQKAEVEILQEIEEIKPQVEKLTEKAKDIARQTDSLLGIIGPPSDRRIYSLVEQHVRNILKGTKFEIKEAVVSEKVIERRKRNMIVKIPATEGLERLPKIILNAHLDTASTNGYTVYSMKGKNKESRGALDDRAGIVAVLSALSSFKERVIDNNLAHGPIVIIFTDLEEEPVEGSKDLVTKYMQKAEGYEDLFDNVHVVVTVDGPLIWKFDADLHSLDNKGKQNPFVIAKLCNISQQDRIYKIISDSVGAVNFGSFSQPRYANTAGTGDHEEFAKAQDRILNRRVPVVNIRAPYNDIDQKTGEIKLHSADELVHVENELVPVSLWLTEIMLGLIRDIIPPSRKISEVPKSRPMSSSPLRIRSPESIPGGIDFRFLPIITHAIGNLSANLPKSSRDSLINVNLDVEWREIENMVNSGIIPCAERIKEYLQASYLKGNPAEDKNKVLFCISDILRLEEERCYATDPTLKDILVVLESDRQDAELKQVFVGQTS